MWFSQPSLERATANPQPLGSLIGPIESDAVLAPHPFRELVDLLVAQLHALHARALLTARHLQTRPLRAQLFSLGTCSVTEICDDLCDVI